MAISTIWPDFVVLIEVFGGLTNCSSNSLYVLFVGP